MLTLGGLGFLLACVFGSYMMSGGSFEPLIEADAVRAADDRRRRDRHLHHVQQHARREAHAWAASRRC